MSTINKQSANQSQKLMVFVLTMALYGLATLFTELIPKFQVGIVEFSVEYFLFIPLTLAMLFDPMSAALGAATGELVFSEIMLGQFGGLGELEKFITVTIGVYIAGRLVSNPQNRKAGWHRGIWRYCDSAAAGNDRGYPQGAQPRQGAGKGRRSGEHRQAHALFQRRRSGKRDE